jgi:TolB-like protein
MPDSEAVRKQLRSILASDVFIHSRRMRRFLEFIVEETLAGRADQLGEYGIGISVFDRGHDFEPAIDSIVRNDARRLRSKLLEYYRQQPPCRSGEIVIEIPKGGYVPVFLGPSPERATAEAADLSLRLAVLPFDLFPAFPEGAVYSRILCLSLTAHLTALEGLEAIAHGYVSELPMREAAAALRASHVIQGTVLHASGRYRLFLNLIQVVDGTQLWACEYDFPASDAFARQSEVTGAVRREVAACLGLRLPARAQLALAA